jgi:hypothetical protein
MDTSAHHLVTLSDRAMAAAWSALCVGATLAALLAVFFFLGRGLGAGLLLWLHLMHDGLACMLAAALVGLGVGSEQLTGLLAHFWGTSRQRRPALTLGLWAGVAGIVAATELASR